MLWQDEPEPDVGNGEDGNAVGELERPGTDEDVQKALREQLRRSLSRKAGAGPGEYHSRFAH
jgi:hypothetical protein